MVLDHSPIPSPAQSPIRERPPSRTDLLPRPAGKSMQPPPAEARAGGGGLGGGVVGAFGVRDPRRLALEKAARRLQPKKVHFQLPEEVPEQHTTYMKSHHFEVAQLGPGAPPATPCLHCKSTNWLQRCGRCGRCQNCSRTIFCKGAEKTDPEVGPGGHVNRLSERMDRAIWDAFKGKEFDPIFALVNHAGVSVNFGRSSKGETALMAASYTGNMEAARELLEMGADPSRRTTDNFTAWSFASKYGHTQVADLITKFVTGALRPRTAPPGPVCASGGAGGPSKASSSSSSSASSASAAGMETRSTDNKRTASQAAGGDDKRPRFG